ncbi:helix-turn-helix domain-containing protein [Teretinema zuelzerae]|nr:helix-turn-helix transcriptional regulator [Teretinema zuelzerae]
MSTQKESKDTYMSSTIEDQEVRFAKRLREERERAKISQLDLAMKAKLSQNMVNFIETGKRKPNLHTILKLSVALNISPAVLFDDPIEEREEAKKTVLSIISRYF